MGFPEKLREVLEELEEEGLLKAMKVEVEPSGGGRYVADVTSPSFADIPEHFRQNMVWGKNPRETQRLRAEAGGIRLHAVTP